MVHITTDQEAGMRGVFWFSSSYPAIYSTLDLENTLRDILRGTHSSEASHVDNKDEPLQGVRGELVKVKLCSERGGAESQLCGGWRGLLEE